MSPRARGRHRSQYPGKPRCHPRPARGRPRPRGPTVVHQPLVEPGCRNNAAGHGAATSLNPGLMYDDSAFARAGRPQRPPPALDGQRRMCHRVPERGGSSQQRNRRVHVGRCQRRTCADEHGSDSPWRRRARTPSDPASSVTVVSASGPTRRSDEPRAQGDEPTNRSSRRRTAAPLGNAGPRERGRPSRRAAVRRAAQAGCAGAALRHRPVALARKRFRRGARGVHAPDGGKPGRVE